MSKPANPLSKFNSYAYQHILVACSNTDVAKKLSNQNDLAQFDRTSPGGRYGAIELENVGEYVVVINAMTDAEFYIDRATWGSVYVPSGTSPSTYDFNSTELDGEIVIIEPGGMRFINVLASISQTLGVATPTIAFLLKTVFVGQNGSGNAETVSGTKPLIFTLVDMSADFDYTGATYKISLVGGRDGLAKHSGISHASGGKTLTINPGQSIGNALDELFVVINENYKLKMDKTVEQQKEADQEYVEGEDFFPITYKVDWNNKFGNFKAGENDVAGTGPGHTVSFQPDLSIHAAIKQVMESSPDLMTATAIGEENDGKNRKYTWKINDEVETTSDNKMIVTYTVNYYELTTTLQTPNNSAGTEILPPKDHVIEWDYVFMGKNVDILDFQMKMDMALAYFMTLSRAQTEQSQAELLSGTKTDAQPGNNREIQGVGNNDALSPNGAQKSPYMTARSVTSDTMKRTKAIETATARNVLASFTAMSTLGVKLKIVGNPRLMEEVIKPLQTPAPISTPREKAPDEVTTEDFSPDWGKIPGYCKINIRMPSGPDSTEIYERFWYEGYYRIHSVQHNFNAGEFTQEIELFSMPSSTKFRDKTASSGKPPSPKATRTPQVAVPTTPSSTVSESTNVPTTLFSEYDDKIVAAANKHGVDPNYMRALFKKESSFNPNAVAGIKFNTVPILGVNKAAGFGQMIPSTARWIAHDMIGDNGYRVDTAVDDRYDLDKNIDMSTWYFKFLLNMWDGNTDLALASYNAGQGTVQNAGGKIPKIKETQDYVAKINEWVALAETPVPTIPEVPKGPDIDLLSSRDAFNSYKGP